MLRYAKSNPFSNEAASTESKTTTILPEEIPYETVKITSDKISFLIPKSWTPASLPLGNTHSYMYYPDSNGSSSLLLTITENEEEANSATTKEQLLAYINEESITAELEKNGLQNIVISDFVSTEIPTPLGSAIKFSMTVNGTSGDYPTSFTRLLTYLPLDNFLILLVGTAMDNENVTAPTIKEAHDYLVQSLEWVE